MREEVLSTTLDHFHAFGDVLARLSREGQVVVVGSQDAIEKANAARPKFLRVTNVL